jgi:acetyltransferase-like isoleucine patch superfamily enzyme
MVVQSIKSSRLNHFLRWFSNSLVTILPFYSLRHLWFRLFIHLGKQSNIMSGFRVRKLSDIGIGDITNINPGCMFDSRGGKISVGNYVDISPEVNIWTLQHDPQDPNFQTKGGPVTIEDYVWIGNRAIILPGVTLGKGSVVAAGAVVTNNVAPWDIVGGIPARKIGTRNPEQNPRKPYHPFLL